MPDVHYLFHRITPALPVALMLCATGVSAQPLFTPGAGLVSPPGLVGPGPNCRRDPGPGVGWSYYGVNEGPTTQFTDMRVGIWNWGWGGFPARGGSFWTNGLSLYGPPIPTYAPIPGSFGGSDAHRFYMNPPTLGFGLNALGYRSAFPRLATPSVSVHPSVALPAPTSPQCARLEVRLPCADAEVWVNHAKTNTTGAARSFESPELTDGREYGYEVIARWVENGQPKAESRSVNVTAGQTRLVDFNQPKE